MILDVVKYGNPVLRKKGDPIETVTPTIKKLIGDMFETMYAYKGVGLAAQQIGQAVQLTVIDVRGVTDRPSTMEVDGKPVDVVDFMPMVLINPELKPYGDPATSGEGCLSFPEIYGEVTRPAFVEVRARDAKGKVIEFKAGGLLARAIQHETDHLNGILFIDRMDKKVKAELKPELEDLQVATKDELRKQVKAG